MFKAGETAPDFALQDQDGKEVHLKDFKGKFVVLYFYPKDDTPGCTIEAIDFSTFKDQFKKANAVILGISKDDCKSHQKFIDKQKLTITLLSDPETAVQKLYGVWGKKKFMGREYMGTLRTTLLIDPKGKIKQVWESVSVKGHAEEVLNALKA
jgi:peroxiredoxin Q/BCP